MIDEQSPYIRLKKKDWVNQARVFQMPNTGDLARRVPKEQSDGLFEELCCNLERDMNFTLKRFYP